MVQTEVRVGVGCFVYYRDSEGSTRILVSKRKGSYGAGNWQLPGGHLEMFESFEQCAQREILEESNISLKGKISLLTVTNNIMGDRHYATIFMASEITPEEAKEARVVEPDKVEGEWEWLTLQEFKTRNPKFSPLQNFLDTQDLSFLD
ncbi:NUDIX hydrolase domain-like protein [Sporodiniella umbellata]|nr:NUDIX hydrolase domain-like protein [Sporodiniella umbellata]